MVATPHPKPFSLCGGHPVLDLVNSLDNRFREDGPHELLQEYADLLRFTEQSGLLTAAQVRFLTRNVDRSTGERTLRGAWELREAAAEVLYHAVDGVTPEPAALRILERELVDARRHQELRWQDGRLIWEWQSSTIEAQRPLWLLAIAASGLLMSEDVTRLRTCECATCRWLFLDTSKNHSRRWCDMKVCGNRMKARRFQARQA